MQMFKNTSCACTNTVESCEKYACAEIGLCVLCENFQMLNHGTKDHLGLLMFDTLHPAVKLNDQPRKIDGLLPLNLWGRYIVLYAKNHVIFVDGWIML